MRIVSWNFQGAADGKIGQLIDYMTINGIEIGCIQESGSLPDGYIDDTETIKDILIYTGNVTRRRTNYNVVQFDATASFGAKNNRCSLVVLSAPLVLGKHLIYRQGTKLRPLLGIKVPGDNWFYSVHAPSSSGAAGVSADLLDDIPLAHARWACFGDFNCAPSALSVPTGAVTTSSGQITHQSGGELDYAVSKGIRLRALTDLKRLGSDHYSQTYQIE